MDRSIRTRLLLLGGVVMFVGVVVWLGGGTNRLGVHPVNLFDIIPGYYLVIAGGLIVVLAFVLGSRTSKKT